MRPEGSRHLSPGQRPGKANRSVSAAFPGRTFGIAGYISPIACVTASYALFQAANNTAVMTEIRPDQRGVISGMLSLSRNLGLITGASVMGAIFAIASATTNVSTARPEAIAAGMRITFAVAGILIVAALTIVRGAYRAGKPAPTSATTPSTGFPVANTGVLAAVATTPGLNTASRTPTTG